MAFQLTDTQVLTFFEYLFGNDEGYACIATTRPPAKRETFKENFFAWPDEKLKLVEFVDNAAPGFNVYFGINLFDVPRRKKANAIPQNLVWADLDLFNPAALEIPPQCVIESSTDHYQAIWRLEEKIDPSIAENYGRRIAYSHDGVDKSGWDVTQLLRVPTTYNFKYESAIAPQVKLLSMIETLLPASVFDELPQPSADAAVQAIPLPQPGELPSVEMVFHKYRESLEPTAFARYYSTEPDEDWSKALWRLVNLCFSVGMTPEEVFVIAKNSKCNKYERDGRPDTDLWREVAKAQLELEAHAALFTALPALEFPQLLTDDEMNSLPTTLIDDYKDWASSVTDAVPLYHELVGAITLSSLMSTTLRLQTKNTKIVPNIWGMILGDSTLTRKTTAMELGLEFIMDINPSLMVATDASPEGLLHELSLRPKMVSIFYRDEVSGLFDGMRRKEYMASLPEVFTKMYDVPKYIKRTLRKETFNISEPIFIMFCGGIPERVFGHVDDEWFTSGFMARFLVVRGYAKAENVEPTGPPVQVDRDQRFDLAQTFQSLYTMYTDQSVLVDIDGQKLQMVPEITAEVDDAVWKRSAAIENRLIEVGSTAPDHHKVLPTFSRMFVSILKLTMLLAAARQEPDGFKFRIEEQDLLAATAYIQRWGVHMVDMLQNSGNSADENKLMAVYRTIEQHPGLSRSQLMGWHKLFAKELSIIEDTLIARGLIQTQQKGRGRVYWPIGR